MSAPFDLTQHACCRRTDWDERVITSFFFFFNGHHGQIYLTSTVDDFDSNWCISSEHMPFSREWLNESCSLFRCDGLVYWFSLQAAPRKLSNDENSVSEFGQKTNAGTVLVGGNRACTHFPQPLSNNWSFKQVSKIQAIRLIRYCECECNNSTTGRKSLVSLQFQCSKICNLKTIT